MNNKIKLQILQYLLNYSNGILEDCPDVWSAHERGELSEEDIENFLCDFKGRCCEMLAVGCAS